MIKKTIESYFPVKPGKAPKDKMRGKGRYFKDVRIQAEEFVRDITPERLDDHWHYHADWRGRGNRGWKYRRQHIEAMGADTSRPNNC